MPKIAFTRSAKTENSNNGSQGFSRAATFAKARRRKAIRTQAATLTKLYAVRHVPLPIVIRVCRVAPSKGLDKWDGLPSSQKPVWDGICDAYGVRDDDPRVTIEAPTQRRGAKGEYAVEIEIRNSTR